MDINTVRIAVTIASFAIFIGILWWALSPANATRFRMAANTPFEEEENVSGDREPKK